MASVRFFRLLSCAVFWQCASPQQHSTAKNVLERENSRYGVVSVHDADGKRFISIGQQEQSGVNLADKREWVYSYMYLLSLGILAAEPGIADRPARVLVIGLGGGSFSDFLAEVYPRWTIDVVEINPAVIRLAKKYFPIDKRVNIIEDDGRAYLRKTKHRYDVILMDAFGEHYIPPELYTLEYFTLLKSRLLPGGLTLMNTWEGNPLEAQEIVTLRQVFTRGYWIHNPKETPGNRIYILGDNLEAQENLQKRISAGFYGNKFTGSSPAAVLADMQDLYAAKLSAEPLTDRTVGALFKKHRKTWD